MKIQFFRLVDYHCYPWTGKEDTCEVRNILYDANTARCFNSSTPGSTSLYRVKSVYRIAGVSEIMNEIMMHESVQGEFFFLNKFKFCKKKKIL